LKAVVSGKFAAMFILLVSPVLNPLYKPLLLNMAETAMVFWHLVKFTRIIIKFHMRTAQNFLKMKKQIIKPKSKMKKKLLRKSLAVDAASLRLKTKILLTKKIHLRNWM